MPQPVIVRPLQPREEVVVCALVARVFGEHIAPEYPAEGVDEFMRFASPQAMAERRRKGAIVLVAECDGELAGMVELRGFDHIALLFVETMGKGIGRKLVERALEVCRKSQGDRGTVTVNASRYALPFYERVGFVPQGSERTDNGITYTPMLLELA